MYQAEKTAKKPTVITYLWCTRTVRGQDTFGVESLREGVEKEVKERIRGPESAVPCRSLMSVGCYSEMQNHQEISEPEK